MKLGPFHSYRFRTLVWPLFLFGFLLMLPGLIFSAPSTAIRLDQVGYLPSENPKLAMVVSGTGNLAFYVVNNSTGVTVYTGTTSATATDADSGDTLTNVDFTPVTATGTYVINVNGVGTSYPFTVAPDAYASAWRTMMRGFYSQRCGCAVTMGVVDGVNYQHIACHAGLAAPHPTTTLTPCIDNPSTYHASSGLSGTRSTPKGWHDAGDYGKYIVNSGISTGEVLWTYEWFKDRVGSVNLGIPESGNGTPDILNEARWNLEWMLTMQDTDGGVWFKNTSAGFGGFVLPEDDDAGTRYVIGTSGNPYKTTASTADFAAVMAIAARVFRPFDPSFATQCQNAAVTAWGWVQNGHTNVTYNQPSDISTGAYGDNTVTDEMLWASAELFRTTGDATYNTYFTGHLPTGTLLTGTASPQDWGNVQNLAIWTYYFSGQASASSAITTRIYGNTVSAATTITARTLAAASGYKLSLTNSQYYWGSNGELANYGVLLLVANGMSPNASFVQAAANNLHYLLGRNTFGLSWVTHLGSNAFRHPHHRPSGSPQYASGAPWPGLLSGGPNSQNGTSDGVTPAMQNNHPARCYTDQTGAYASNEVAINWQAPLVFLAAGLLPAPGASTPTFTPSRTPTPTWTGTATPSGTPTFSRTWTATSTPTATMSFTASSTATSTPTNSPSPTPTATPSFTPTATATRTATPSPTPTGTPTSTWTRTATASATATATSTPSLTPTTSNSPTFTGTSTPTASATATRSFTPSETPTRTVTSTATVTGTPTITATPTTSPTGTLPATWTYTVTFTPSLTPTPTWTPTVTPSPTSTWTATATDSSTATATASRTGTFTETPTGTFTATSTPTEQASFTPTPTPTGTATASWTATPSWTSTSSATRTVTVTWTATSSATGSPTATAAVTFSSTGTPTATASATPTASRTNTFIPTPTNTPTATPTFSATPSYTPSATPSPIDTATSTPSITPIPNPGDCSGWVWSAPYPNPDLGGRPVMMRADTACGGTVHWTVFTSSYRRVAGGSVWVDRAHPWVWDPSAPGAVMADGLYHVVLETPRGVRTTRQVFVLR